MYPYAIQSLHLDYNYNHWHDISIISIKKYQYHQAPIIRLTKSPNLNVSRHVLQFYPSLLKPGVKSRKKM